VNYELAYHPACPATRNAHLAARTPHLATRTPHHAMFLFENASHRDGMPPQIIPDRQPFA